MAVAPACSQNSSDAGDGLTVFAAASLKEVLDAAVAASSQGGGGMIRAVYAGSSQLARQIDQGAPADLFISADLEWMDWLAGRQLVNSAARRVLAANALVLVAPARSPEWRITLAPGPLLAEQLVDRLGDGRLATAEPDVPAGRYGQQAMTALGIWPEVESRLAPAENVRAALAMVAHGEAPLGIVYATDARAEPGVRVVGVFPSGSHAPILYPAAPIRRPGANTSAATAFLDFLSGPAGQTLFHDHGFAPPP